MTIIEKNNELDMVLVSMWRHENSGAKCAARIAMEYALRVGGTKVVA